MKRGRIICSDFTLDPKWRRPSAKREVGHDSKGGEGRDVLRFQLLDCVQSKRAPSPGVSTVLHVEVPEIRLYGITSYGASVCVHAYNFEPYLFVEAPLTWSREYENELRNLINQQLSAGTKLESTVVRIETFMKSSLMNFAGNRQRPYLKIVTQLPQHVPKIRSLLSDKGLVFPLLWDGNRLFPVFEANVIFPLRFLVDNEIGGCHWLEVDRSAAVDVVPPATTCHIDIECGVSAIRSIEELQKKEKGGVKPGEVEWAMKIAPWRILSFDIECMGQAGAFPEPETDPVIQIACHCICFGGMEDGDSLQERSAGEAADGTTPPLCRVIFTLGSCAAIAGAVVYSYDSEEEMLVAWSRFVLQLDPDIITGYNITGFDLPYLLSRAAALNITSQFSLFSRLVGQRVEAREKKFQSKQMGNREYKEVAVEGRVILDMMVVIQRDYKLRSYRLNSVSQHFLKEQKEDVHHSIIGDLQRGNEETRRRLAVYCLKDAYLPVRLMEALMVIVNNVEMSRVTGVPFGWLLDRGQQIKVFSQMLRKGRRKDLLFPTIEPTGGAPDSVGYEGAIVIEPVKGFYNRPIATLDFASLYPSIMMAHNLCYSTLIRKTELARYPAESYTVSPSGDCFVKKDVYPGILPEILDELLSARRNAKAMMKDAKTPMERAVLNGRQLALKVSANSVYGFTGAQIGKLPCLEISSSVTSFGRQMIERTKQLVEEHYEGVQVIYGDTDSVMIQTVDEETASDDKRLATAMEFGKEAAAFVTTHFQHPIKLEFEKVYHPFLLMNKKRYAGLLWTRTEKYDKLDAKGIETVRRDNCPLVANVISGVLNRILIQRSVSSAVEYVKGIISDLLLNRLDMSNLVITKAFTKGEAEYENKQAHIALVERMRKRDAASAPMIGDRVAYVITRGAKGAKAFERSEDPIYVLENNIPIDVQYYLEHHLSGPIQRVFEGVLADPGELLHGEHTRRISNSITSSPALSTPGSGGKKDEKRQQGNLLGFVKLQLQCLSCRASISKGALCARCHSTMAADVYGKIVAKRNHYEGVYCRVWTQCQQCQGSLYQEVLCTSRDCPVFYVRRKVQKDLADQQALIDRFGIVDDW